MAGQGLHLTDATKTATKTVEHDHLMQKYYWDFGKTVTPAAAAAGHFTTLDGFQVPPLTDCRSQQGLYNQPSVRVGASGGFSTTEMDHGDKGYLLPNPQGSQERFVSIGEYNLRSGGGGSSGGFGATIPTEMVTSSLLHTGNGFEFAGLSTCGNNPTTVIHYPPTPDEKGQLPVLGQEVIRCMKEQGNSTFASLDHQSNSLSPSDNSGSR